MAAVLKPEFLARPAPRRPAEDEGPMASLARMAEAAGVPPTGLLADLAALSLGPGRIAFADYERLLLYDTDFWGQADRRQVVGSRRARELALRANFRRDWFGLAANRIALATYLAAYGLPGPRLAAIYAPGLATPGALVLRGRDELREFLARQKITITELMHRADCLDDIDAFGAVMFRNDHHVDPVSGEAGIETLARRLASPLLTGR